MNVGITQMNASMTMASLQSTRGPTAQERPDGPPPQQGPARAFQTETGEIDTAALLEQLTADFGEEAVAAVTTEDGSIDFDALKSFLDDKVGPRPDGPPPKGPPGGEVGADGMRPPPPPAAAELNGVAQYRDSSTEGTQYESLVSLLA